MKELTFGKPMKLIIGFALPVLLGLVFQQAYTLTDIKSLACAALCVARTFLFRLTASAADRPAAFKSTKIVILIENRCFFAQQNSNIKTVNKTIDG